MTAYDSQQRQHESSFLERMRSIKDALGQQTDRLATRDGILANVVVALLRPTVVNTIVQGPGRWKPRVSMSETDSQPLAVGDTSASTFAGFDHTL